MDDFFELMNNLQDFVDELGPSDELDDMQMNFIGGTTVECRGYEISIPSGFVIQEFEGKELYAYLPGIEDEFFERMCISHVDSIYYDLGDENEEGYIEAAKKVIDHLIETSNFYNDEVFDIKTAKTFGKFFVSNGNSFLVMAGYHCCVIYRIMAICSDQRLNEIVRFIAGGIVPTYS